VLRAITIALLLGVVAVGVGLWLLGSGLLGSHQGPGRVTDASVPEPVVAGRTEAARSAAQQLGVVEPKQILFGDLHVHTTFSADAFLGSLPFAGGEGAHPPADACDFARFCSALDFWSINDHAEFLTPRHWRETIDSVRQCNAVAGDAGNPDLVSYLGWEWTQIGFSPEDHYGHKNVVLRDLGEDEIPTRPIGAGGVTTALSGSGPSVLVRALLALRERERSALDFGTYFRERAGVSVCPQGVPVRELPADCYERAATPGALFAKLDDWGHASLVIPHGTAWGMYTPPGSSWDKQLSPSQHDPARQTMIEVYSGHGNSEEYRDWREVELDADGSPSCPEPRDDYLPSCWRAGEIIRARCEREGGGDCDARAAEARRHYAEAGIPGWRTVPGAELADWLDSGQCRDCFQPSFNHRPKSSAQYMLALTRFAEAGQRHRFRFGFMASSDNHTARGGTGYKEVARRYMVDAQGSGGLIPSTPAAEPVARSTPWDPNDRRTPFPFFQRIEGERATSFLLTGGLIALHSSGRAREAIWDAFERNEMYATSGPRLPLWFDLVNGPDGRRLPMGAAAELDHDPEFEVRAVGSLEQRPGCPDHAASALGPEGLERLCRGECYHPSDERRLITRIEVVRIRPQALPDEPLANLIQDPWRIIPCEPDPAGCSVRFADPGFLAAGRDAVYYVRAVEEESLAINAGNLRCSFDERGRCVAVRPCRDVPDDDDCLTPTEQRAWSSPIYLDVARSR
jgi:hypothetical protein